MIQSDAPAALGSSGGPSGDDANVLGLMTFVAFRPAAAASSRVSIPHPRTKDVLKFLSGTEVTNAGQSPFNPVWAADVGSEKPWTSQTVPNANAVNWEGKLPFTPAARDFHPCLGARWCSRVVRLGAWDGTTSASRGQGRSWRRLDVHRWLLNDDRRR
jgi:hypothetical protein